MNWCRRQLVVWECSLQMAGATEADIPLWGKNKKKKTICQKQILIIIHHAAGYSTAIILFTASLWGFIPPWKHWSLLHDRQHGLLGLTCKLITSDLSSAFSLLGRQIETVFSPRILESLSPAMLLSKPEGCWEKEQLRPRDGEKPGMISRSSDWYNITDVSL